MRMSDWSSDVCSSDRLWVRVASAKGRLAKANRSRQHQNRLRPKLFRHFLHRLEFPQPATRPALQAASLIEHGDDVHRTELGQAGPVEERSEEHTSELQSLMRISYAVFCLKKKKTQNTRTHTTDQE